MHEATRCLRTTREGWRYIKSDGSDPHATCIVTWTMHLRLLLVLLARARRLLEDGARGTRPTQLRDRAVGLGLISRWLVEHLG